MALKFTYCLFLMTCFYSEKDSNSTFNCPTGATCWSAPAEEISSDTEDGLSFSCPENCYSLLYDSAFSLRSTHLNSIVVQKSSLRSGTSLPQLQIKLSPLSLVLDDCSLIESSGDFQQQNSNKHSSFFRGLFRADRLRYLTLLRVSPIQLDWTGALSPFTRLNSLYIESCYLQTLDDTFALLSLPALRTLVIRSSKLEYIDREAFSGGLAETLERLILADNRLKNALYLSAYTFPMTWHLDLSKNELAFVPPELVSNFPILKELNLAGNKLKYYNARAILPQLGRLLQFRLEGEQKRNTIFYTAEAKEIFDGTKKALATLPAFYLDSLSQSRFQLPGGGLVMWNLLTDTTPAYDYQPDRLFLKKDGALIVDKESMGNAVRIISGSYSNTATFLLDEVSTVEQYRHWRKLFVTKMKPVSTVRGFSLRLRLFGKRMLDHLSGKGKKIPDQQLKLMAGLLEEVLDEAAASLTYIVLVLFHSADFPWTAADESVFPFSTLSDRYDDTVRPLLLTSRVARHSALVGFELMDDFMGTHPRRPVDMTPTATSCVATYKGIEWEMVVVGKLYYYLKSHSNPTTVLYGLSVDAGCKACVDLATMIDCRERYYFVPSVAGMDVDFFTFISKDSSKEGNEALGFMRITKVQREALNGRDGKAEMKSRAIFYRTSSNVILDDVKREKLLQFSNGFFLP